MTCVALTPCDDASPFRWIAQDGSPWSRLVSFGPSGFAAYARLRFVPDPAYEGQQEADADAVNDEAEQLRMVFDVLAEHTRTPRDCYFCLWEGTGDIVRPDSPVPDEDEDAAAYPELRAQPARVPKHAEPPRLPGPLVSVPHRSYYLFHGALSEAGAWSSPKDGLTSRGSTSPTSRSRGPPTTPGAWPTTSTRTGRESVPTPLSSTGSSPTPASMWFRLTPPLSNRCICGERADGARVKTLGVGACGNRFSGLVGPRGPACSGAGQGECRGEGGFSKGTPDSDNLGEGRSALEASGASPVMGAPAGSLRKNVLMMPITPAPMR